MSKYYYNADEKVNRKSWMSLFAYARLELPEIAELL